MANPPKKKGTGAETELRKKLADVGVEVKRTSAGMMYDLYRDGDHPGINVLATRPDSGRWLLTMDLDDFGHLFEKLDCTCALHIEVKRYKQFAFHRIYEEKFG